MQACSVNHTWPTVPALGLSLLHRTSPGPRVDLLGLPDDEPILDQLADVQACTARARQEVAS